MPPYIANLLNGLLLMALPAWAYLTRDKPSLTALIPAGFGLVLLACTPGVKSHNKIVAHVAVLLTLLVFVALGMPLFAALQRGDGLAIGRVVAMMVFSAIAMVAFVRSFIEARKKKAASAEA